MTTSIALLPQPQSIRCLPSRLQIKDHVSIGVSDHSLFPLGRMIAGRFPKAALYVAGPGLDNTIVIRLIKQSRAGGYELRLTSGGIRIEADSVPAAFYAWQTLAQILDQTDGRTLPCLVIRDWPDLPARGLHLDLARGRVPKLDQLMRLTDELARYKINQLQLYIQHTFSFRAHPLIGQGASPLTADDILRLDAFCRERHVDLVPTLATFGHMETVLCHPPYRRLAEDWGIGKYISPDKDELLRRWPTRMTAFTLSPANPDSYRFLDSLFAEFLPLFSSPRFMVCCDEVIDLGYGQSYQLCRKLGKERVYLGHIRKLNELAHKYGKTLMFWGDIIRHYPELIALIPKDVTVLDWGYSVNHPVDKIKDFVKTGLSCYACPSTASYGTLFPHLPHAACNIAAFAGAASRHGAQGLLNTVWGDDGYINLLECDWHGLLFGAEQGWNVRARQTNFTRRFCRLFLKSTDAAMVRALDRLGDLSSMRLSGYGADAWWHMFFAGAPQGLPRYTHPATVAEHGKFRRVSLRLDAAFGRAMLKRLEAIRRVFDDQRRNRGIDPIGVLPYWIMAVDMMRHAARKIMVMGLNGRDTPAARRQLVRELAALRRRYRALWLARNRPSDIRNLLLRFRRAGRAITAGRIFMNALKDPEYVTSLRISRALPFHGPMMALAYPEDTGRMGFNRRDFISPFCDFSDVFMKGPRSGIVYAMCPIFCRAAMSLIFGLGYDGPLKVWFDGRECFCDPRGANPAGIDKAIVNVKAAAGRHEIMMALHSNRRRACGIRLRVVRQDAAAKQERHKGIIIEV